MLVVSNVDVRFLFVNERREMINTMRMKKNFARVSSSGRFLFG